ncbi:MAG: 7,8-didemethyl-8-hydroxy-5-deazariboflavin synthase subunit CofH, partial [Solirubrobacterales bacterium]|nr:7,8-didemethyl-8-hydroxy-5-deazariboflavin synthase subunit CofH [Solirubrobacterales bacterium]
GRPAAERLTTYGEFVEHYPIGCELPVEPGGDHEHVGGALPLYVSDRRVAVTTAT